MEKSLTGNPTGVVIATDGRRAEVSTWRVGACAGCSEAGACGITEIERCEEIVTVRNAVGAGPGDLVELDLPGDAALRLSLLVWLVPAAGLVLGALAGAWLGARWPGADGDLATLLGALVGTVLAWVLLRRIDRTAGDDPRLTPFITRVRERRAAS